MNNSLRRRSLGFTLIEILIALTLFSLILVMVFSTLHSSGKTWQAGDRQVERNDEQRLMLDFIRNQIAQTVPLVLIDGKKNRVIFQGEQDKLGFVSRLPAHRGGGGLYWQSLSISAEEANSKLNLAYEPVHPDTAFFEDEISDKTKTAPLIKEIKALEFSYFGKKKDEKNANWHDEWKDEDRLPILLRMQIVPERTSSWWPELFIAIRPQPERGQPQLSLHKPKAFGRS